MRRPGFLALAMGAVLVGLSACGSGGPSSSTPSLTPSSSASPSPSSLSSPTPSLFPSFVWESRSATAADAQTWREGCPVGLGQLIVVDVAFWTFDGETATGELVVNADIEDETRVAFERLFDLGFPIRSIRNIDEFTGSDDASMAADNTSGFNCRYAVADGDPQWSNHAYGRAIDVNPVENPYVFHGEALPPEGAEFVDRTERPGMLAEGGAALQAFLDAGFFWGGFWKNTPDYQHLEIEE